MPSPGVNDSQRVAIVPAQLSALFYAPGTSLDKIPL